MLTLSNSIEDRRRQKKKEIGQAKVRNGTMPRVPMSLFLRLLRADGRGRRFVARHRRHGVGDLRRFWRGGWNHRYHQIGAGPTSGLAPLPVPSAPMLGVAAPPPPFWCSAHGWEVCPLHEYGPAVDVDAVGQSPTSVFEFGGTSSAAAVDADVVAPCLPPPTPAVVEMEGDALAYVSAPTGASIFAFGSGVRSFSSAAADDAIAPPRLPSPTPATPLPSPRTDARRRLVALGLPLPSSPSASSSSSRGRRAGTWSPAALGLANGTLLPDDSPSGDERGESSSRRR